MAKPDLSKDSDLITSAAPAEVAELDLYEKREKIYTRSMEGFFQRIRLYTGWPLLLGYFTLPWLMLGDRPLILFDLPARKFHLFGYTFWPQDLSILGLILVASAIALFFVTSLAGRVWCGYTCPQTVWTAIFMWIEQHTEGTRNQRIKLDKQPWDREKVIRKSMKHIGWLGFAVLTGVTFIGYFTPIRGIVSDTVAFEVPLMTWSWILFFTLATYINAGWAREQVCKYVCPYARFQAAMFDRKTLIISYDAGRGEPRGARKRQLSEDDSGKGSCVDCRLCVQVCPTGIDIREGLQYECISCALCIDACNSIMEKMGYQRDLIRYTTEQALAEGGTVKLDSVFKRWKVIAYAIALVMVLSLLAFRLGSIAPVEITVTPDRLALTSYSGVGAENRYVVKIVNKGDNLQRATLSLSKDSGLQLIGPRNFMLQPFEVLSFPVRVAAPTEHNHVPTIPVIPLVFELIFDGVTYQSESRFVYLSR